MPETELSPRSLNRATLARQMLLRREKVKPLAAIERLAAIQAQIPRPPFVGLWSRVEGFRREDLIRLVAKRQVVRATMMRATIHLVSSKDYAVFRPALQESLAAGLKVIGDRGKGLDIPKLVEASRACFANGPCTFEKLRDHLSERFPKVDERAMGYAVRLNLPLVMIPADGAVWGYSSNADFALPESWLGAPVSAAGTDANANAQVLAMRYFAGFGPASVQDFQSWSGFSTAAARAVVDAVRPQLRTFRIGRRELLDLPKAPRPPEDEAAPVRFIPEYDGILLGYADRTRIVADESHKKALVTKNLIVPATFLVDGFIGGLWTIERKKRAATLRLKPFGTLTKAVRGALEEEGEQLVRFVEPDAETFAVDVAKG